MRVCGYTKYSLLRERWWLMTSKLISSTWPRKIKFHSKDVLHTCITLMKYDVYRWKNTPPPPQLQIKPNLMELMFTTYTTLCISAHSQQCKISSCRFRLFLRYAVYLCNQGLKKGVVKAARPRTTNTHECPPPGLKAYTEKYRTHFLAATAQVRKWRV